MLLNKDLGLLAGVSIVALLTLILGFVYSNTGNVAASTPTDNVEVNACNRLCLSDSECGTICSICIGETDPITKQWEGRCKRDPFSE